MTRRELLARMGEDEFREWLAFDRIHPLPDAHWDAALIASTFAKVMGAKGTKLEHFLPQKAKPKDRRQLKVDPEVMTRIRRAKQRATKEKDISS